VRLGIVVAATKNPYIVGAFVVLVVGLACSTYRRYQRHTILTQHTHEGQDETRFWTVQFIGGTGEGTASGGVRPDVLESFKVFAFKGGDVEGNSEFELQGIELQGVRAEIKNEEVRNLCKQRRFSIVFLFSTIWAVAIVFFCVLRVYTVDLG
jgi:hypothetical protein